MEEFSIWVGALVNIITLTCMLAGLSEGDRGTFQSTKNDLCRSDTTKNYTSESRERQGIIQEFFLPVRFKEFSL